MATHRPQFGSPRPTHGRGAAITCWAAAILLGLQSGCAAFKAPGFRTTKASSDAPADALTGSQLGLKLAFAKAAEGRGDWKHALSEYQEIVQMNLASATVHHRIALIYDREGNYQRAEEHYLNSLKMDPDEATVCCDYGYSLYLRESWEAAESQFQRAINADPQYLRARVNYGMLLARTGRPEEAMQQFALGGLSEGAAHHNIALAATENGDTRTATTALEKSQLADHGRSSSGNHHSLGQVVERIAAMQ